MYKIHPILKELASIFGNNGKQLYLVGGAVRDMLMGKNIHDWDLATDALPEETTSIVKAAKGRVIPTGIKHGTVTVLYKNHNAEVTTFRTESLYSDGRRPDKVQYASDIKEDLSRRDFTMNAIALRLPDAEIIDPFEGVKDIKKKTIRCVGEAKERFNEDGLRPLRAVRFAVQLDFEIEKTTEDAISGALSVCSKVSWERVRDELDKILASAFPSRAFLLMEKTGLLELFLPELAVCRGVEQKGFHSFDVLDHLLLSCDYTAAKGYSHELRLAALLHDIGKPDVRRREENENAYCSEESNADYAGIYTFYRHEEASKEKAGKILNRLRYSNAIIDSVCHLVKEHMFHYTDEWSDAAVRRFIARIGENNIQDMYCLRRADAYAFSGKEVDVFSLAALADRVNKVLAGSRAFKIKDLAINGKDLMTIGIESGKSMGIILKELLETVLDDPEQNTKEKLLEIAIKLNEKLEIRNQE